MADVNQHRTGEGWVYLVAVQDVFSRRIVGWAIADHVRTELVVDALQMAIWRRGGKTTGTIHHSDHAATCTSWLFGQRLRDAGLLGSMSSIGDCFDSAMAGSFFATLQTELLDRREWPTRQELPNTLVAYTEGLSRYAGDLGGLDEAVVGVGGSSVQEACGVRSVSGAGPSCGGRRHGRLLGAPAG